MTIKIIGDWRDVYKTALLTVNKTSEKPPTSGWKYRMLKAEHSPIRKMFVSAVFEDIPYFVSVHLSRHKVGIEHFVSTQRTDRTGHARGSQNAPVTHEIFANFQAIINISRKRLCHNASEETRATWQHFIDKLAEYEPELAKCCLPDCEYRGCYEVFPCRRLPY